MSNVAPSAISSLMDFTGKAITKTTVGMRVTETVPSRLTMARWAGTEAFTGCLGPPVLGISLKWEPPVHWKAWETDFTKTTPTSSGVDRRAVKFTSKLAARLTVTSTSSI